MILFVTQDQLGVIARVVQPWGATFSVHHAAAGVCLYGIVPLEWAVRAMIERMWVVLMQAQISLNVVHESHII